MFRILTRAQRLRYSTVTNPKITQIVNDISTLNLLEASQLVNELKQKLNISDVVMAAPSAPASTPAATQEPVEQKQEQSSFKLVLQKIDAAQKAKIIKEIKQLLGCNLVEAKKFVEGVPKTVKDQVGKEEAEKMKKLLESVGGSVTLE